MYLHSVSKKKYAVCNISTKALPSLWKNMTRLGRMYSYYVFIAHRVNSEENVNCKMFSPEKEWHYRHVLKFCQNNCEQKITLVIKLSILHVIWFWAPTVDALKVVRIVILLEPGWLDILTVRQSSAHVPRFLAYRVHSTNCDSCYIQLKLKMYRVSLEMPCVCRSRVPVRSICPEIGFVPKTTDVKDTQLGFLKGNKIYTCWNVATIDKKHVNVFKKNSKFVKT